MARQKKVMKVLIIIIFLIFILSTWLVTVMYLTDPNQPTDWELTWSNLEEVVDLPVDLTWENLDLTWSSNTWEIN